MRSAEDTNKRGGPEGILPGRPFMRLRGGVQRSTTASTSREDRIWNSWPSYLTSVPP